MQVEVLATPSLGDRSYLVSDGQEALVVDPQRDVDRFLELAADRGLRIAAVAETHVHNDYLTGGPELARRAGADYLVAAGSEVRPGHDALRDGDERTVGGLTVRALLTPGHTPDHLAYAVTAGTAPGAVFTGGSLLYGTVGRTDLVSAALTGELARAQHRSVRRLLAELPTDTAVYPTHGFGSHCSAGVSRIAAGTIGDEQDRNPAAGVDEEDFVRDLLAGFGPYPTYYARMAPLNRAGPPPLRLDPPPALSGDELVRRVSEGQWLVDLRPRRVFAAGHLTGALNVELADSLPEHIGWLLAWNTPLLLLADRPDELAAARLLLARIGFDRIVGTADAGWPAAATETMRVATFADLDALPATGVVVLDVRERAEHAAGHRPDAVNIPYHDLPDRLAELRPGQVWVHCASGRRAAVAASFLARAGRSAVLIDDDWPGPPASPGAGAATPAEARTSP